MCSYPRQFSGLPYIFWEAIRITAAVRAPTTIDNGYPSLSLVRVGTLGLDSLPVNCLIVRVEYLNKLQPALVPLEWCELCSLLTQGTALFPTNIAIA